MLPSTIHAANMNAHASVSASPVPMATLARRAIQAERGHDNREQHTPVRCAG
jgi:hypothetical protein